MLYSIKLINKQINNTTIKHINTDNYRNLFNKTWSFNYQYRISTYINISYVKKYFTTNNSDDKTSDSDVLSQIIEDSTEPDHKSSLVTKESTNLTFSLIQDAFDSIADEYSKNISSTEFTNSNDSNISKSEFEDMTPAQKFYAKNKEKLINNAKKIFLENNGKIDTISNIDDPVIRPPKNHVWEYGSVTISEHEHIILKKGHMPTINDIIKILEREHFVDSVTINLDECNRRDVGLYVIISTGKTFSHCRRVGRLLYRIFVDLEIPFVSEVSYARSSRNDEWIIAHLGPLHVYLMTQDLRNLYKLEEFWSPNPDITTNVIESNNPILDNNNNSLLESECDIDKTHQLQEDVVYNNFKKDDDYG